MSRTPRFSILICTVGKADLVVEAISSIRTQTFQNFEIIVTDTSGTSYIKEVVAATEDPRVHFFAVPDNDPSSAWDFAYEQSHGDYVLWYDDDNCLVPWALERYQHLIETTGADIVSGNHAYYYGEGNRHSPAYNNALSFLLPFSLVTTTYKKEDILTAVFNFEIGSKKMPARWHSAATFVARTVCQKAKEATGHAMTPRLLGNFHFHPLLFSFAKKPVYDDRPLCVIGKMASSITQQWSNSFTKQSRSYVLPFRFTGVSARTLGNTTAECYLQTKALLPEILAPYHFNFEKFYARYARELSLINLPVRELLVSWRELWHATEKLSPTSRRSVRRVILKTSMKGLIVVIFKSLGLWNTFRLLGKKTLIKENANRNIIPLGPLGVFSISECAKELAPILKNQFGLDIQKNVS